MVDTPVWGSLTAVCALVTEKRSHCIDIDGNMTCTLVSLLTLQSYLVLRWLSVMVDGSLQCVCTHPLVRTDNDNNSLVTTAVTAATLQ